MTLETMLNKLISLGWKPRYKNCYDICDRDYWSKRHKKWNELYLRNKEWKPLFYFSLNDLCSLDSWLRQFVCWLDNDYLPFCSKCNIKLESNNDKIKWDVWYEEEVNFRLMLSSIQQDKAKFLLENIKIPE